MTEKATCPNCGHRFEYEWLKEVLNPENETVKMVQKYMDECDKKFKAENPCPKCGSHNVDIDWGTPMWCNDCGHEWVK